VFQRKLVQVQKVQVQKVQVQKVQVLKTLVQVLKKKLMYPIQESV
jgi:hypothetical protein